MPRVPVSQGPQVLQNVTPGARVSTDAPIEAFGGGRGVQAVGEAMRGLNTQAQKLIDDDLTRLNNTRIVEERDALNKWERDNLYGEKGALRRQGKNAFGVTDEVSKSWGSFLEEREKGLSNDDQKVKFKELSSARWDAVSRRLNDHVAAQTKVYEEETYKSSTESSKERGSLDPRYAPQEAQFLGQQVQQRAQALGWDEERTNQELRTQRSDLYSRVIQNLTTAQQDVMAEKFFASVKDQMDPDVARQVTNVLEESSVRGFGQRKADELVKSGDMGAALAGAREIEDPKRRDETERRVKQYFADQKTIQSEREDRRFTGAANIAEQTKDRPPPAVWANLTLPQRNAIDARVKQLREGIPPTTDWQRYYDLQRMATNPSTAAEFAKMNLMMDRHRLDDAKFTELTHLQGAVTKGDEKSLALLDGIRADNSIVSDALLQAGIDPTPKKGTGDAEKSAEFRRQVDERVVVLQQRTGKKVTNEQVQSIVDDLLVPVKVPGVLWGTNSKPAFQLKPEQAIDVEPASVPRGERAKIEQALRSRGMTVTDKSVAELYRRKLEGARR